MQLFIAKHDEKLIKEASKLSRCLRHFYYKFTFKIFTPSLIIIIRIEKIIEEIRLKQAEVATFRATTPRMDN